MKPGGRSRRPRQAGRRIGVATAVRWIVLAVLILLVAVYLAVPIGFGVYASMRHPDDVGDPPTGFANVTIVASDRVRLEAWYAQSSNGAAIVLLHGATASREEVRDHARMLAAHGYGVIAPDLRGHGESGGDGNAFGWEGTRDVRAAIDYLQAQEGVRAIGGLGLSLGGEVLLGALNATPALGAVVAEGATYRSLDEFMALPGKEGIGESWFPRVTFATVGVLTGDEPPVPIVDAITTAPDVPLLLIAAGEEPEEAAYADRFAAAAGERAEVWVVPDVGHTAAFAEREDEYSTRVEAFLDRALIEPGWEGE